MMYSVVLSQIERPELSKIDAAHRFVMERVADAVRAQIPEVRQQGICDLTYRDRKCSGNSLRIARRHLLYHGTVLYDFDVDRIGRCLKEAPRQPEYRQGRDHDAFVTNVPIDPERFATDLSEVFGVTGQIDAESLRRRIRQLRQQRYDDPGWNFRH